MYLMWRERRNDQSHNKASTEILHQKSTRQDTSGWRRWSTGNCERKWDLTIRTSGICTTRNWSCYTQSSLGVWNTNKSPNLGQTTRPSNSQPKKKKKLPNNELSRPGRPQGKIKRNEKRDNFVDFAWELKNNMERETVGDTNCNLCS